MFLQTNTLYISNKIKTLCANLSLTINPGDRIGLRGANGSGKTTLLHTLAGLLPPSRGEIFLNEKLLHTFSRKEIARKIGILFQDSHFIFPQTVLEYCYSGRHPHVKNDLIDSQIVLQTLQDLKLENLSQQNVLTLSGGEKRRLAIATVLAQTPEIYFLDEPTNHLDIRYQWLVLNHFKNLAEKNHSAIMMALHDLNQVRYFCNKVLLLFEKGETLYGSCQEILTTDNLCRLYQCPKEIFSHLSLEIAESSPR